MSFDGGLREFKEVVMNGNPRVSAGAIKLVALASLAHVAFGCLSIPGPWTSPNSGQCNVSRFTRVENTYRAAKSPQALRTNGP